MTFGLVLAACGVEPAFNQQDTSATASADPDEPVEPAAPAEPPEERSSDDDNSGPASTGEPVPPEQPTLTDDTEDGFAVPERPASTDAPGTTDPPDSADDETAGATDPPDSASTDSAGGTDPADSADDETAGATDPADSADEETAGVPFPPPQNLVPFAEPDQDLLDDRGRFKLFGELPISDSEVESLIEFVEAETGRPFLRPPAIVALPAPEFAGRLAGTADLVVAETEIDMRRLQSLGLTEVGVREASEAYAEFLASPEGLAGYYEPFSDQIFMPLGVLDPDMFRAVLVHELTHALDDQHLDLSRLDELYARAVSDSNFEPFIAFRSVVEGRATSVETRWRVATGTSTRPTGIDFDTRVPIGILIELSIPYEFGVDYIEALGGTATTWDLFDDLPLTTEEIIFPAGEQGVPMVVVPRPQAEGPVIETTVFGAADMLVWLVGDTEEPPQAEIDASYEAMQGWAGGSAVLWGDDTESCTRIALVADTAGDLAEIVQVSEQWAGDDPDRSVVVGQSVVTVTGCAPFIP